ncbi:MAG: ABC transporter substrate-binding protein [Pseudomonadota bacterium]
MSADKTLFSSMDFQIKLLGALSVGDVRTGTIPSPLPSQKHYLKVYIIWTVLVLLACVMPASLAPSVAGETANIPQRIVSLSPSITEGLFQLGLGDKVVGVTTFCKRPAGALQKPRIGTVMAPNIEAIVSIRPDIVIASETNPPQHLGRLRSLGIKTMVLPPEKSYADICRSFLTLGTALGVVKSAKAVIASADKRISIIQRNLKTAAPVRVFWEAGAQPLVTMGPGTFIDQLISMGGGLNIARHAPARYVRYSREEVLKQDPEAIILVTMGDVTRNEITAWRKYKALRAVKNNRIHVVDAHFVCSPTPLAFAGGLEIVSKLLHPEICPKPTP